MNNYDKKQKHIFISLLLIAFISLILICFHQADKSEIVTALMCALSAMSLGIVVGFLFGIPKTIQIQKPDVNTRENIEFNQKAERELLLHRPNTNLEEISDWLTKIIVGISLVEFNKIGLILNQVSLSIATSMGDPAKHQPYIMAFLIFYLMFGFMTGYLLTRVFFEILFSHADLDMDHISHIKKRVDSNSQIIKNTEDIVKHIDDIVVTKLGNKILGSGISDHNEV